MAWFHCYEVLCLLCYDGVWLKLVVRLVLLYFAFCCFLPAKVVPPQPFKIALLDYQYGKFHFILLNRYYFHGCVVFLVSLSSDSAGCVLRVDLWPVKEWW